MRGLLAVAVLLAACSAPAQPAARPAGTSTAEARAALLGMTVTDVRSGEPFRLAQFKGKVVIALGIAAW